MEATTTTITVNVTPEMAMEILQTNIRNRPMNKNLVLFYSEQMAKGKWKFNGETVIISSGNILLDGQHRLAAIVKSKTTQKMIITRGIDDSAFDTIDVGRTRTAGDMLSILNVKNANRIAGIIVSHYNLSAQKISLLNGKSNFSGSVGGVKKISKADVISEYYQNPEFWEYVYVLSKHYHDKLCLFHLSVIGGYIAYLIKDKKHSNEKVESFFNQLFYEKDIQNITILQLREKLLQNITGQMKMTPTYKHALIVKTWNCYVTGKEFKVLKFNVGIEQFPEFI